MELYLFLALIYFVSLGFGSLLERFKIPWLFAPLLFGTLLSFNKLPVFSSETFVFLANLGMFLLLFMVGFELEWRKILKQSRFIIFIVIFTVTINTLLASIVIISFGYSLFIAVICALSLATIGEGVLLPILEKEGLVKSRLGQTILSIGVIDDVFEVITIVLAIMLIGSSLRGYNIFSISLAFFTLFLLVFGIIALKKKLRRTLRKFPEFEDLFLLALFILFTFLTIGKYAEATALGSLLAGIALRNFLPQSLLEPIEQGMKILTFGVFAPLFFFWVGVSVDFSTTFFAPLLTFLIFSVSVVSKILVSLIAGKRRFGLKRSFLLGVGLSVRFSTGIVIAQLLFTSGFIDTNLFTALVAASSLSTLAVPLVFSWLLGKWKWKVF
jgi:Ca2+-transporting ATPase